jgi:hypothetical protein
MKAREFWIDDILNVDRPKQKTAYAYYEDTENFNGKTIHVREVMPIDWEKVWKYLNSQGCYDISHEVIGLLPIAIEKSLKGEL